MNRKDLAQHNLDIMAAYRRLMLNEDGSMKPDAEIVLRDLEKECGTTVKNMPTTKDGSIDPLRIAENFAKSAVYRHIKERLFAPISPLRQVTEETHD